MALNTLPNAGLTSRGYPSDRIVTPIIINGDMSIAQRGTSVTGVNTNNGFPTLDRFQIGFTSSGTYDMSQSTDVPSGKGFSSSLKIKCASTDTSIASGDEFIIQQRIEAQNLQYLKFGTSNAENLTLSFYAKAVNKTGTYCVHLQKNDSTSAYFYSEFSVTTSWQKFSISIPANSVVQSSGGAISNDNGIGIIVMFFLMNGSSTQGTDAKDQWSTTNHRTSSNQVNFLDSTSNEFYLTGVQMEVGEFDSTSVPSFPFESFESNLRKCQRYYYKHMSGNGKNICSGNYYDSGTFYGSLFFPVPMRASPTIEMVSGTDYYRLSTANSSNNGLVDDFNVGFIAFAGDGISIGLGVNSGLSGVGGYGATMSGNNSSAELAFGSEL